MEDLKTKERSENNKKRKIMFFSAILTFIIIVILLIVIFIYYFFNKENNTLYEIPNSYSFSGNILSTTKIYNDIDLVIEEKNNSIYGVTLRNNELVAQKEFNRNIDYSKVNDFNLVLDNFNNDSEKDFIYLFNKDDEGFIYKFYTVTKNGEIKALNIKDITVDSKKASLKLSKVDDEYQYKVPNFYFDGYKVAAEIGEHKLVEKNEDIKKTISRTSKISVEKGVDALPRKVSVLKKVSEYILNVNSYLTEVEDKYCIEVDLDGDNQTEYIIGFFKDGKTYINLFDNSANFIVNIFLQEGKKEISEILEIADVDDDDIMEMIILKEEFLEIHKYNRGFYY